MSEQLSIFDSDNKSPVMTNKEKYKEVFGFYPDENSCFIDCKCNECKYRKYDDDCCCTFWDSEYKGVTNGTEDADQ